MLLFKGQMYITYGILTTALRGNCYLILQDAYSKI